MYLQLTISAPSESEARAICDVLLTQKLIAGSLIVFGNARYWWENEIVERIYWNINAYSVSEHKEKIILEVKKLSSDECPIISFSQIDGSKDFLKWIADNTFGNLI